MGQLRALVLLFAAVAPFSARADVLSSPTVVGILSAPATSDYTSIEADDAGTGSKLTGPWRFTGAVTFGGAATFGSTLHVVGAATFDSTATAPHFNTTDSGGLQLGGAASVGLFNDATNLSLRVPNSGGALSVETPSAAAYVPVKALNFQSQDSGTPQFGGAAVAGVATTSTDIALRSPGSLGTFRLQNPSGAVTRFTIDANGHYVSGGATPFIIGTNCGFTGQSLIGTDTDGVVFVGTAASSCTVNFGSAYASPPICTWGNWDNVPGVTYSRTATTFTISVGGIAGHNFSWHCAGL